LSEERKIRVKIFRFNPVKDKEPRYETYEVPFVEGMSILNLLNYVYENIDSSLAYYYSCRIGRCGCCDLIVNGRAAQSCCTLASDNMIIEPPLNLGFKVIKDLISSDVSVGERNKLFIPNINAFHRFNKAYMKVKGSSL